jgi:hypothetical protein
MDQEENGMMADWKSMSMGTRGRKGGKIRNSIPQLRDEIRKVWRGERTVFRNGRVATSGPPIRISGFEFRIFNRISD